MAANICCIRFYFLFYYSMACIQFLSDFGFGFSSLIITIGFRECVHIQFPNHKNSERFKAERRIFHQHNNHNTSPFMEYMNGNRLFEVCDKMKNNIEYISWWWCYCYKLQRIHLAFVSLRLGRQFSKIESNRSW